MTESRNSLHKYAMQFGTYMGLFWIFKFILFPAGLRIPFLQLLFLVLTIAVPFLGYYYARMFRNKVCGGSISFFQAWVFTVFMYMFAALLTAVAHYVYFQFIDHGFIVNYYLNLFEELKNMNNIGSMGDTFKQMEEAFMALGNLTPIELTMQLISQNVLYGSFLAIPTALFVMKKKKSNMDEHTIQP